MSVTIKLSKRAARGRWGNRARAAAAVLASAVAVGGVGTAQAAAATPTLLSYTSPTRLVQSTGNLYWTTNSYNRSSATYTSTVYRASKTNTPGDEITLFSKSSATPFSFGDLTYAEAGGTWYGYFVVNYPDAGYSQIARIGLYPDRVGHDPAERRADDRRRRSRDRRVLPVLGRRQGAPQDGDRRRWWHRRAGVRDELLARRAQRVKRGLLGG